MGNFSLVTYGILIINIVAYLKTKGGGYYIEKYGMQADKVLNNKEFYRLVTCMFMHANPMHIFFNMYGLWSIGLRLENSLGHVKFLAFYMGMGILTGLLSCIARKQFNSQSTVSIGASGVLYALFGIYIGMLIRVVGLIPAFTMSFSSLLPIIIISFIPGIDVYAHISGLLVGICTGFFI